MALTRKPATGAYDGIEDRKVHIKVLGPARQLDIGDGHHRIEG